MRQKFNHILITSLAISRIGLSQNFDPSEIERFENNIYNSLQSDGVALEWKNALDDVTKSQKFSQMLTQVGDPPLSRVWIYPGLTAWPLVNWDQVDQLDKFIEDQSKVLNQFGIIAQSNEESAKILTVGWLIRTSGKDMKPWFESWIIDLAKSQKTNLKTIAFLSISNFAEDISRESGESGEKPMVNWNAWQEAFNQSDELGKAIILICIKDLASRFEKYDTAKAIHEDVFAGTNDELKAIALYQGSNQLGENVKVSWQDIANNHANPKLKSLAQQAINLWSN